MKSYNILSNIINSNHLPYITLFIFSIGILFQSPLAPSAIGCISNDSSIFINIAKNLLDGHILYVDVTDHKGPMIFIMNAIGLKLFNGKLIGIWLLEIISLFVASIFIYKTVRILYNNIISLVSTIFSILFIIPILSGGNLTEEWALPYISIALYHLVKNIIEKRDFTFLQLFILSYTFIMAFLFKASYIGVWCAFGLVIIIQLIRQKKWKLLYKYIFSILTFCFLTTLPFFIYFYHHNALKDAYFWMIEFNTQYGSTSNFTSTISFAIQVFLGIRHLPIIVISTFLFTLINGDYKQNKTLYYCILLSIILTTYSCSIGNCYEHYNIIFAPLLSLFYSYLLYMFKIDNISRKIALLILTFSSGYIFLMKQIDSRNYNYIFKNEKIFNVSEIIKEHSNTNDYIMGDHFVDKAIFVHSGRTCINKYQCNSYSPDITKEILTKKPTIFIHNKKSPFNDTILSLYTLKKVYDEYEIYKKNER